MPKDVKHFPYKISFTSKIGIRSSRQFWQMTKTEQWKVNNLVNYCRQCFRYKNQLRIARLTAFMTSLGKILNLLIPGNAQLHSSSNSVANSDRFPYDITNILNWIWCDLQNLFWRRNMTEDILDVIITNATFSTAWFSPHHWFELQDQQLDRKSVV